MSLAVNHHLVAERARWQRRRDRCCDKEKTYMLPGGNIIIVGDDEHCPLPRSVVPARVPWYGGQRNSRYVPPENHVTILQGIGECRTKELTAWAPSTMKSRWWIHQCEGSLLMIFFFFLSSLSTFQQVVTSKGMYDESGPRAHDADRVRDTQRARHERGEPGRFVSVCLVTRNGHDQGVHSFGTNDGVSTDAEVLGEHWRICPLPSVPSSRSCSRRSTCLP